MKQAMKKMGVQQTEIDATEVIIRTAEKEIVILEPQVAKVVMMGQESYQISGQEIERSLETAAQINDEDIHTVMAQVDVDYATAKAAIEAADGDLAQAILDISE